MHLIALALLGIYVLVVLLGCLAGFLDWRAGRKW